LKLPLLVEVSQQCQA